MTPDDLAIARTQWALFGAVAAMLLRSPIRWVLNWLFSPPE